MLEFRVLGPLEVVGERGPVSLGGPRQRATLAILLLGANRVVPVEAYLGEALKLAEEIATRAPVAVRAAKKMITQAFERTLSEGLAVEKQEFGAE